MNVQRVSRRLELRPLATAVAGLLASGALTATAHAQQENGLGPAETEIESIVVTASRRATTIQDLPFNIAAVSGATLEQQRVTNLTEVARWVPGLTVVDQ